MFTRTLRSLRQPRLRLAGLGAALIAALVVTGPVATGLTAADSSAGAAAPARKPTIVLVHGAWADSSMWSGVVRRLQADGYPVRVPPVGLRSLSGDSRDLAQFVSTIAGPVVLVGHSYGGGVITNMPADPEVRALVYVDGFAPAEGEQLVNLSGPDAALAVSDPSSIFDFVPYTGGPEGDIELYLKEGIFRTAFANDLSRRKAAVLWATQPPVTASSGSEPSGPPAWKSVPSWYVLGTRDLVIPPATQRAMAKRAGSTVVRARAGHLSPVSRPGAVTAVIETAASATAG